MSKAVSCMARGLEMALNPVADACCWCRENHARFELVDMNGIEYFKVSQGPVATMAKTLVGAVALMRSVVEGHRELEVLKR